MEYIKVVASPQGSEPDLDIVFVHGLNPKGDPTHAEKTWTHQDNTFWPKTLLPTLLPTARIILFAFNSSVLGETSNASSATHAQSLLNDVKNQRLGENERHRPLIFIAHSLGGLLVKQALIGAAIDANEYGCLKASTYGLVFFATPHLGGNKAGIADVAANLCSSMTGRPKSSLLSTLQKDSLVNEISSDQFRHQLNDYKILTFFETKKMNVFAVKKIKIFPQVSNIYIVDSTSARLRVPNEKALELDRNHSDICKFALSGDHAYARVSPNLKTMADEARKYKVDCNHASPRASESSRFRSSLFSSDVPGAVPSHLAFRERRHRINLPQRYEPFVGRKDLVNQIQDAWKDWDGSKQRRLSLSGLGGVGKTELSRFLVGELDPGNYVIWMRANDQVTLQQDLYTAAFDLRNELIRFESANDGTNSSREQQVFYHSGASPEFLKMALRIWLSTTRDDESRVLLVLDDLDGLEANERQQLSDDLSGDSLDVIFTTRDPLMADIGMSWDATNFDVPVLQVDAAAQLLLHSLKRSNRRGLSSSESPLSQEDQASLQKMLQRLGPSPSAVMNASHYMRDYLGSTANHINLDKFLARWENNEGEILRFRRILLRYPHSILTSVAVSISRLKRNAGNDPTPDLDQTCLALLRLLSMMNIKKLRRRYFDHFHALLSQVILSLGSGDNRSKQPYLHLQTLADNPNLINTSIVHLERVSLLSDNPSEGATLLLHGLVRSSILLVPTSISIEERAVFEMVAGEMVRRWTAEPPPNWWEAPFEIEERPQRVERGEGSRGAVEI